NLFEMMQVLIGAINAFTTKCVVGVTAQREKATAWLGRNAIVVTALNPVIGYQAGAELVKEAMKRNATIREVAATRIEAGTLAKKDGSPITLAEVDAVLSDLRKLTDGGLGGPAGGG
ncbi:MAG: hypothetical protein KA750_01355, partial [Thermoflexales bacterium]|nr:hypothetical protein [Thermoflexales bacterium]